MARIEWMLACELAYFDRHARLCMVGVATQLLLPSLPLEMRQLMLVARLVDRAPGQSLDIGFAISTPGGQWLGPSSKDDIHIEVASEYALITVRDLPFKEEGMYRFGLRVDAQEFVAVGIPVLVLSPAAPMECH
jgi:hypothetical protein